MPNQVNSTGKSNATARIRAGDVDRSTSWSFSAADENALLGPDGDDWAEYARWHLAIDTSANEETKARYKYAFGKNGRVYRSGIVAIRQRAGQQDDQSIFAAAGTLLEMIDANEEESVDADTTRAYSTFKIKTIDDFSGEFEGIASTPATDRVGDIVEPKGAQFTLPLPLLWQHRADEPIGLIISAKVTGAGITVKGKIEKDLLPRISEAWALIKRGLVRGLSIGFRSIEAEPLDAAEPWGPQRFLKWDWLELSAVTIPANAEANIQTIKSQDVRQQAASGSPSIARLKNPGATGSQSNPKGNTTMNIAEQILQFEAKRTALIARNEEIMAKAAEDGRTLEAGEQEEYDTATQEIDSIDSHIKRLQEHEKRQIAKATPVPADKVATNPEKATEARQGGNVISVRRNLPKGTAFTRYAMAIAASRGQRFEAIEIAKQWKDTPEVEMTLKAAVAVGDSVTSGWASQLVYAQDMATEFIELLRPMTIVGRMPSLRRVPFNVRMPRATSGTSASWVGQGSPKPVSRMTFDSLSLTYHKMATIVVLTEELVRLSNPSAEAIVRQDMLDAIAQYTDQQFIDPTVTASGTTSPASVTNGASSQTISGTTIAAITTDISALFGYFSTANIDLSSGVFVMHPRTARYLSMLRTTQDVFVFPTITQEGGTFFGVPVITSNSVPIDTGDDSYIFLVNQSDILLADEGGISLDISREASVQMDDAPSAGAQALVSLWQNNLVGLRAERMITWARRRDAAVAYLDGVSY